MADFQFFPLILGGKAVGEINGYTVDLKTGGEQQIGGGFIMGISTGVLTVGIKATSVTPNVGHSVDMMQLAIDQTEFGVGFPYNGRQYVLPMKITELSHKSEAKNGQITGDITITQAGTMVSI